MPVVCKKAWQARYFKTPSITTLTLNYTI